MTSPSASRTSASRTSASRTSASRTPPLPACLPRWIEALSAFRSAPGVQGIEGTGEIADRLALLERRYREGPGAPLRIAFLGPTGAGKSKLFNSLLGEEISPSGFRRPCTREAVAWLHQEWSSLALTLAGRVVTHREPAWRDVILIDTPDFDSVESANREAAHRVWGDSDSYLFVVDPLKYADAVTTQWLARVLDSGKPLLLIVNKVEPGTAESRVRERVRERWGERLEEHWGPVFEDLPIDDAALIAPDRPALVALRERVLALGGGEGNRPERVREIFRADLEQTLRLAERARGEIARRREELEGARRRTEGRFAEARERLEVRLESGVGDDLRAEVRRRMIESVERIDPLRYPRQLLAMPVVGIKRWLARWRGREPVAPAAGAAPAPSASPGFSLVESLLLDAWERTRRDLLHLSALAGRFDREVFRRLRIEREDLARLHAERLARFREEITARARETAGRLSAGSKAKFVLSQLLVNSVLVGVQVHTGGAFTLLELGFDGLVSPWVAKAVGLAISSEEVREFERLARRRHVETLGGLIDQARDRFLEYLREAGEGASRWEEVLAEVAAFVGRGAELAEAYARGDPPPPGPQGAGGGRARKEKGSS